MYSLMLILLWLTAVVVLIVAILYVRVDKQNRKKFEEIFGFKLPKSNNPEEWSGLENSVGHTLSELARAFQQCLEKENAFLRLSWSSQEHPDVKKMRQELAELKERFDKGVKSARKFKFCMSRKMKHYL